MIINFQCKCEIAINWTEGTAMNNKGTAPVSHVKNLDFHWVLKLTHKIGAQ